MYKSFSLFSKILGWIFFFLVLIVHTCKRYAWLSDPSYSKNEREIPRPHQNTAKNTAINEKIDSGQDEDQLSLRILSLCGVHNLSMNLTFQGHFISQCKMSFGFRTHACFILNHIPPGHSLHLIRHLSSTSGMGQTRVVIYSFHRLFGHKYTMNWNLLHMNICHKWIKIKIKAEYPKCASSNCFHW